MIRRLCCVALMILAALLLIPAELSSQSAASKNVTVAASEMAGGCAMFSAAVGGGTGDALPQSAGKGFNVSNLDRSVTPCSDFYQFADGGWAKNNPMPADHSSWATFNKLHDKNEDVLRQILEEASKDKSAAPGSNWQKIGDYYASCMDEAQIEEAGIEAARSGAPAHRGDQGRARLQAEIARLQREGRRRGLRFRVHAGFQRQLPSDRRRRAGRTRSSGPRNIIATPTTDRQRCETNTSRSHQHVQADGRRCLEGSGRSENSDVRGDCAGKRVDGPRSTAAIPRRSITRWLWRSWASSRRIFPGKLISRPWARRR